MSLQARLEALAVRIAQAVSGKLDKTLSIPSANGVAGQWTIVDDGSSTSGWPNRFSLWFAPSSGTPVEVFALNEYGEIRNIPAKTNTTAFRIFGGTTPTAYTARSKDVILFEVSTDRTNRVTKFGVYPDGDVYAAKDLTIDGKLYATNHPEILALEDGTTIPSEARSTLVVFYDPDPM